MAKQMPTDVAEFISYVNAPLTDEDIDQLSTLSLSASELFDFIAQYVNTGYKFELTRDKEDAMQASLYGVSKSIVNAGYKLAASAFTVEDALLALYYKAKVKCTRDWSTYSNRSKSRFR